MDIEEWELLPMDGLIEFKEGGDPDKTIFHHKLSRMPNWLVPASIHLNPPISSTKIQELKPETNDKDSPVLIIERDTDNDQDVGSQVLFKKMKENELVDMKMDSPRSGSPPSRGIIPQVDVGNFQYDEESENLGATCSPRKKLHEVDSGKEGVVAWKGGKDGFNIWKWSLNGIGALCSFGFATITICIFIIGSSHQNRNHHQNQNLQFQIFKDDKPTMSDG